MKPWSKLLGGKQKSSTAPVQVQLPQHPLSHLRSHLSPSEQQPHQRREQEEQPQQPQQRNHELRAQQPLGAQQQYVSNSEPGTRTATGPLATAAMGSGTGLLKTSPPAAEAVYEGSGAEEDSIEDEFRRGMQEVHEMRDKYEGLLGIAVQAQQRSADLSGSLHDLASFVEDAFGKMHEGDIGAVFLQVAAAQEGIARLFHAFSEHVGETIVGPTETLLAELAQVEETKSLYEEKRHVYGQLVLSAKAKQRQGHRKSGKGEDDSLDAQRGRGEGPRARGGKGPGEVGGEELEGQQGREEVQAKEEFDEIAMTLGCRILNLEQQRPRRLLTQALRYLTAKRRLFREGAEQLLQVDPLVRHLMQQLNATERQILAELLGAEADREEGGAGGAPGEGAHERDSQDSGSEADSGPLSPLLIAPPSGADADDDEDEEDEDEDDEAFFHPRQTPGLAKSMVEGPRKPFGVLAEAPAGLSSLGSPGLLGARKPFVSHSAPLGPGVGIPGGGMPGSHQAQLHQHHPLLLSSHPPVVHVLPTSPSQLTQLHTQQLQQQQQQQQQAFHHGPLQGHPPLGPSPLKSVLLAGASKPPPRGGAPAASQGGRKAGSPQGEGTGEEGRGAEGRGERGERSGRWGQEAREVPQGGMSGTPGVPRMPGSSLGLLTMSGPITSSQPLFAPRLAHKNPVPLFSVHMSGPLPSPSAVEQEHYHQQLHLQQAGAQGKEQPPAAHEVAQGAAADLPGGQGQGPEPARGQAQGLLQGRKQKSLSPETSPSQADEDRHAAGAGPAKGDKGLSPLGAPPRTVSMSGPITVGSGGEQWTGVAKSMTSLGTTDDGVAPDLLAPFTKPLMSMSGAPRAGVGGGGRPLGSALNAGSRDDLEMPWQQQQQRQQQQKQQLLMQQQAQRRRPVSGPIPKGTAGLMLSGSLVYAMGRGTGAGLTAVSMAQGQGLGQGQGLAHEQEQRLSPGREGHAEEAHELHRLPPPPLPATGLAPAGGAPTNTGAGSSQGSGAPARGLSTGALGVGQSENGDLDGDSVGMDTARTGTATTAGREGVPGVGAGPGLAPSGTEAGVGAGPAGAQRAPPAGAKGASGAAKGKGGGGPGPPAPLKGPPGLAPLSSAALRQQQQHAAIQQVFHQQQMKRHGQAGSGEALLPPQGQQGEHAEQGQAQGGPGSGLNARAMLGRAGLGVSRNPSVPTIYSEGSDEGESITGSSIADSPSISSASSPRPPQEDLAMLYRGGGPHEGVQYRPHARTPMGGPSLPSSASVLLPPSATAFPPAPARGPAPALLPAGHVPVPSPAPAAPPSSVRAPFPSSASVPLPGPPGLAAALPPGAAGLGVATGFRAGGVSAEASAPGASSAGATALAGKSAGRTGAGLAAGGGGATGARGREDDSSRMGAGRVVTAASPPLPHSQDSFTCSVPPLQRGGPALSGGSFRSYSEANIDNKDEPSMSC